MNSTQLTPPDLMTEREAAELRRQSVRTLQAERVRGGGCPFVKIGRSVRYRRSDVLQFIEQSIVTSTTEADAREAGQ
jgi:excisionase family DNA binding protein